MFPLKLPLTVLQVTCLLALMLGTLARAAPSLQFVTPTNGAVFSTLDEIPIVLRPRVQRRVLDRRGVRQSKQDCHDILLLRGLPLRATAGWPGDDPPVPDCLDTWAAIWAGMDERS